MVKKVVLILLMLLPSPLWSQDADLCVVDDYVRSMKASDSVTIEELALRLTEPFHSEKEKVRAVFYWIASHIEYKDGNTGSRSGGFPSVMAQINETYITGKGDCRGYANLFRYMLEKSGVKSIVITGHIRTGMDNYFTDKPNHAWNAAKIEGKWQLFDVTWAAASEGEVNDLWFMTDPEVFVLNHYPGYQPYTYTSTKYSLEDFSGFPVYTSAYYKIRFTEKLSKEGHFVAENGYVTIPVVPRFDCLVSASLYDIAGKKWGTLSPEDIKMGDSGIRLRIPVRGELILKLGAIVREGDGFVVYKELVFYSVKN